MSVVANVIINSNVLPVWDVTLTVTSPACLSLSADILNPNKVPPAPPLLLLAGMGPATPISIKIIGGDSRLQIKTQGSAVSSPEHQNTKAIIYISHKWLHLTAFLRGKKKKEKSILVAALKCENDHLYNTAPGLNTKMPTMQMEIKTAQQTNSTEVSQKNTQGFVLRFI